MTAPVESHRGAIPRRATLVWLGLVVATVVTFWLGSRHPFAGTSVGLAASIAITIGIGKAVFIGLEFMELRHAPPGLRYAFLAWCVVVGGGSLLLHVL
ncbi:MAG: cytochrome C oxidase subunit IV family protein [Candidatus Binatia bacterium]